MQYTQRITPRGLDVLKLLPENTKESISKYTWLSEPVRIWRRIEDIKSDLKMSDNALGKVLRETLYGIAWVTFITRDIGYPVKQGVNNFKVFTSFYSDGSVANEFNWRVKSNAVNYKWIYLSDAISDNGDTCLDLERWTFEKEVDESSCPSLRYLFDRSLELREKYGNTWYPKFTLKEISSQANIAIEDVKKQTHSLVWIIAESRHMRARKNPEKKYFIPKSKFEAISSILDWRDYKA